MIDSHLWAYENEAAGKGYRAIAGIDEAGRGPLAGPVVAAAVILPEVPGCIEGLMDSKKLTPRRRGILYGQIYHKALSIGIGIVDPAEIDRINILRSSLRAMAIAVSNLSPPPDFLLVDGTFQIESILPQLAVPKGDALSASMAAASIVAKVTRDQMMERYDLDYPQYAFKNHKGYPTRAHREAIRKYGICPIHRRSFRGVKEMV